MPCALPAGRKWPNTGKARADRGEANGRTAGRHRGGEGLLFLVHGRPEMICIGASGAFPSPVAPGPNPQVRQPLARNSFSQSPLPGITHSDGSATTPDSWPSLHQPCGKKGSLRKVVCEEELLRTDGAPSARCAYVIFMHQLIHCFSEGEFAVDSWVVPRPRYLPKYFRFLSSRAPCAKLES